MNCRQQLNFQRINEKQINVQLKDNNNLNNNKKTQQIINQFSFGICIPTDKHQQQDNQKQSQKNQENSQKQCIKILIFLGIFAIINYCLLIIVITKSKNSFFHQLRILIGIIFSFGIINFLILVLIISLVTMQNKTNNFDVNQEYRLKIDKKIQQKNDLNIAFCSFKKYDKQSKQDCIKQENSSNIYLQNQKQQQQFPQTRIKNQKDSIKKTKIQLTVKIINKLILLSILGTILLVTFSLIIRNQKDVTLIQVFIYSISITVICLLCKLNTQVQQLIQNCKKQQIKKQRTKTELQIFLLIKKIIYQNSPRKHIFKTLQQLIEHTVNKQQIKEKSQQNDNSQLRIRTSKDTYKNIIENRKLRQRFERISLNIKDMPIQFFDNYLPKGIKKSATFHIQNILLPKNINKQKMKQARLKKVQFQNS